MQGPWSLSTHRDEGQAQAGLAWPFADLLTSPAPITAQREGARSVSASTGSPSPDDHGACGEGPHCPGATIKGRTAAREP